MVSVITVSSLNRSQIMPTRNPFGLLRVRKAHAILRHHDLTAAKPTPVPPSLSKCHHFSSLHVSLKLLEITLLGSNFIRSLYDWCFLAAYGSSFLSASPASRTGQDFHRPSQPFVRRSLHSKIQTPKLDPGPRTNPNHLKSKILHEGSRYFI